MLPDTHYIPVSLDTNRVYTFTVDQKPDHTSYGAAITVPELRKVQWSGQTIYDIEVCEIHKGKMEHEEVRVLYGLIRPEPGEPSGDEEQRLFPHRHEMLLGGCVSWPNSPKTKKVYVCGECTKAFDKWKSEKTQTK
jgi:hypothetical protein